MLKNLREWSVEGQTDIAARTFEDYPSLSFYGISGNHDYSFTKQNGVRPLGLLESKLDNFSDLGDYVADVEIHGVIFRLLHGSGGGSGWSRHGEVYLQNLVAGGEGLDVLPDVLMIGHFHKKGNFRYAGVEVVYPGSFQGQNELSRRKGWCGPLGGYLLGCVARDGLLARFSPTWISGS